MAIIKLQCIVCDKWFSGRPDKKFCTDECKNEYHNARKMEDNAETKKIRLALNRNRNILRRALSGEKVTTVERGYLLRAGYDFDYHTHHHHTSKGEYIFCFDYGYIDMGAGAHKVVKSLQ